MKELLTTAEAAEVIGLSPRTLEYYRRTRTGPRLPYVKVAHKVKYRRADLERLIEESVVCHAEQGDQ